MPDYTVDISGSSTMMIRDTGGNVEFWFRTGPSTWNNEQGWSYTANGSDTPLLQFRLLRGGDWQKFGEVYVPYDQDVRFTIYGSGLGFPTYDFWQHISRSTVPGAPFIYNCYAISSSQIHVDFTGTTDGGSAIVEWQIGFGGSPSAPEYYVSSDGHTNVGTFSPGSRVYFWARGRNAVGWSPWSNRAEATSWRVPDAPNGPTFSEITQTSIKVTAIDKFNGGTDILERQLGYGLDPVTPSAFAGNFAGVNTLTSLDPGKTYYFWARVRNSIGWGPWSVRTQSDLIAGSRVLVGTEWKRAVPYVRVAGIWKVVRPWVRDAGIWKETSL